MPETVLRPIEPCALDGLEVAEPDCIAEDFGGEIVVLNSTSGVYYSLSGLAAAVWRDLMAAHSVESLLKEIRDVDDGMSQAADDFIRDLKTSGLLRSCRHGAPRTLPSEIRRAHRRRRNEFHHPILRRYAGSHFGGPDPRR